MNLDRASSVTDADSTESESKAVRKKGIVQVTACRAYAEARKDLDKAAALFRKWLDSDAELRTELLDPLIDGAIRDAIQQCVRDVRKSYANPSGNVTRPITGKDNISGIALVARRCWYDYPLPGGKLLGDALPVHLAAAIKEHQRQSSANAVKAQWLTAISEKMRGSGKRVRDVISEATLEKIAESSHVTR